MSSSSSVLSTSPATSSTAHIHKSPLKELQDLEKRVNDMVLDQWQSPDRDHYEPEYGIFEFDSPEYKLNQSKGKKRQISSKGPDPKPKAKKNLFNIPEGKAK